MQASVLFPSVYFCAKSERNFHLRLLFLYPISNLIDQHCSSICKEAEVFLTSLRIAPNTKSARHKPSRATVQLKAETASRKYSWSLVYRYVLARILWNAINNGAWYLSKVRVAPGISIAGAPRLSSKASKDYFIPFYVYADPSSTKRYSGRSK